MNGDAADCRWHERRCETVSALCLVDCAHPAPAPGGRTRDAREEIARALTAWGISSDNYRFGEDGLSRSAPDAVLAVPTVADALALRERVRALAEELAFLGASLHDVPRAETFREAADDLRRALDGE